MGVKQINAAITILISVSNYMYTKVMKWSDSV